MLPSSGFCCSAGYDGARRSSSWTMISSALRFATSLLLAKSRVGTDELLNVQLRGSVKALGHMFCTTCVDCAVIVFFDII